ncbi:MAG: hypothetical protein RI894_2592 [Bacteroidota bacterium]|jgi:hypothetical protein
MKRASLLVFSLLVVTILFSSYAGGPVLRGAGDRTGRANVNTTCKSCHSGTSYGTVSAAIVVKDGSGIAVTSYTPGAAYTVTITITKTAGTPVGWAFQWVGVKASDNTTNAGTPTATQTSTAVHANGGRQYMEQTARLATNIIIFNWTAPIAGTGSVKMYAVGLAVNGNNNDGGIDTGSASTNVTLTEAVVATDNIAQSISNLKIFPNPVANMLNVQLASEAEGKCTVEIADISGRLVKTQNATLATGANTLQVSVENLISGIYAVRIVRGNETISATMIKQ